MIKKKRFAEKQKTCCDNPAPKHDKLKGEVVCQVCGTVIKEKTIGQLGGGGRSDTHFKKRI